MDDLLQSQILDSCKLAMPEGLKDLMSDISREVLRAQPKDILSFITDYLSCLLVTRENLHVACHVYDRSCGGTCTDGLEGELRKLDIIEEDVETITTMVDKYFASISKGRKVNESVLVNKLLNNTSIVLAQVPEVLDAIRRTLMRAHVERNMDFDEESPIFDDDDDDVTRATHHTLKLYKQSEPIEDEFHRAAARIQAAYRAYGVRREKENKDQLTWHYAADIIDRASSGSDVSKTDVPKTKPKKARINSTEVPIETGSIDLNTTSYTNRHGTLNKRHISWSQSDSVDIDLYQQSNQSTDFEDEVASIYYEEDNTKQTHDMKSQFIVTEVIEEVDEEMYNSNKESEDIETMNVQFDDFLEVMGKSSYKSLALVDSLLVDDENHVAGEPRRELSYLENDFEDEDEKDRALVSQFHNTRIIIEEDMKYKECEDKIKNMMKNKAHQEPHDSSDPPQVILKHREENQSEEQDVTKKSIQFSTEIININDIIDNAYKREETVKIQSDNISEDGAESEREKSITFEMPQIVDKTKENVVDERKNQEVLNELTEKTIDYYYY